MSVAAIGINFTAKYSRTAIIEALRGHLEAHKKDHAAALEGYVKKKGKLLRDYGRAFKKDPKASCWDMVNLPTPVDAAKQYESTIKAFEMAEGNSVELAASAADAIFNDTWPWATAAKTSNSAYR